MGSWRLTVKINKEIKIYAPGLRDGSSLKLRGTSRVGIKQECQFQRQGTRANRGHTAMNKSFPAAIFIT